jgi:hypothetical protein
VVSPENAEQTPRSGSIPDGDDLALKVRALMSDLVLPGLSAPGPAVTAVGRRERHVDRTLDIAAEDLAAVAMDPTIEALHDVAGAVFQRWLDGLGGKACSLRADNERLARLVMERANRFGFGLYVHYYDELVRVRIDVGAHPNRRAAPDAPSTMAGAFQIHAVRELTEKTTGHSGKLTAMSTFPRLIVARSLEHARAISAGLRGEAPPAAAPAPPEETPLPDLDCWTQWL